MSKTISKTFRIPAEIAKEIALEAKKRDVSQAQYFVAVFTENKFLKMQKTFHENLKEMKHDDAYQKEEYQLAEANFL